MRLWLFSLLLLSLSCFGKDEEKYKLPQGAHTSPNMPSFLIEGLIDPISGDISIPYVDHVVPGPCPLKITRYFHTDPHGHTPFKILPYPELHAGGYNYCMVEPSGSGTVLTQIRYPYYKGFIGIGVTNASQGLLSARTNVKNWFSGESKNPNNKGFCIYRVNGSYVNFRDHHTGRIPKKHLGCVVNQLIDDTP